MMWKNQHKPGNRAVLVNAPRAGLRNFEDVHWGAVAQDMIDHHKEPA